MSYKIIPISDPSQSFKCIRNAEEKRRNLNLVKSLFSA